MSNRTRLTKSVSTMIDDLKSSPSGRFSKAAFQMLVYSVLADKDFKSKKYLLKGDTLSEVDSSISSGMRDFMDKLLKHAGVSEQVERDQILDGFEYSPKDIEWIMDSVDEAMSIYTECGKNMRMFRDKMLQLSVKKSERTGKYAGKVTYKKKVVDRNEQIKKED